MGDVLSQNEIDNLLAALSTGELDVDEIKDNNEKKVKEYDFARPSKFSKEHLRTLEIRTLWQTFIYESARVFTEKCSGRGGEFRSCYLF